MWRDNKKLLGLALLCMAIMIGAVGSDVVVRVEAYNANYCRPFYVYYVSIGPPQGRGGTSYQIYQSYKGIISAADSYWDNFKGSGTATNTHRYYHRYGSEYQFATREDFLAWYNANGGLYSYWARNKVFVVDTYDYGYDWLGLMKIYFKFNNRLVMPGYFNFYGDGFGGIIWLRYLSTSGTRNIRIDCCWYSSQASSYDGNIRSAKALFGHSIGYYWCNNAFRILLGDHCLLEGEGGFTTSMLYPAYDHPCDLPAFNDCWDTEWNEIKTKWGW